MTESRRRALLAELKEETDICVNLIRIDEFFQTCLVETKQGKRIKEMILETTNFIIGIRDKLDD